MKIETVPIEDALGPPPPKAVVPDYKLTSDIRTGSVTVPVETPPVIEDVAIKDVPKSPGLGARFVQGMKNVANSVIGSIEGLSRFYQEMDKYAEKELGPELHKKLKDEYKATSTLGKALEINQEELAGIEQWSKETYGKGVLEPIDLPKRKGVQGFIDSVVETAPQIVAQIGVTAATGGIGGVTFMGSQIFGGKYKTLVQQGVEPLEAFKYAALDASIQGPMEQVGISRAFKFWKPGSSTATIFRGMIEGGLAEGFTEFLQQYPDEATEIWAVAKKDGKTDQEAVDLFLDQIGEITQRGVEAGAVGGFFGVLLGGVGAGVNRPPTAPHEDLPPAPPIPEDIGKPQELPPIEAVSEAESIEDIPMEEIPDEEVMQEQTDDMPEEVAEPEIEDIAIEDVQEVEIVRDDVQTTPVGEFTPEDVDHAKERHESMAGEQIAIYNELETIKNADVAPDKQGEQLVQYIKREGGWLSPGKDKDGNVARDPNKRLGNRGEYDYWKTVAKSKLEESRRVGRFLHNGTLPLDVWFEQHRDTLAGMGVNDLAALSDRLDQAARDYDGTNVITKQQIDDVHKQLMAISNEVNSLEEYIAKQEGTDFDPATFFDQAESELAQKVDTVIGEVPAPGGLSIAHVGPVAGQPVEVAMKAPLEQELRMRNAHGLPKEGWTNKAKVWFRKFYNKSTRQFELLESGAEFAQIKQYLTRFPKQRAIAIGRTLKSIQGIVISLNHTQYALLERKVLYDDLIWEAQQGRDLPFGFTPDMLYQEHARITTLVGADPAVAQALLERTNLMNRIRATYQNTMQQIGLDPQFDNPHYFRHQVINYANMVGRVKVDQGITTPGNRGFLKKRLGSEYDINTDYMQAEGEVMAQMLHDMEVAKIILYVQKAHDVSESTKDMARKETGNWRDWKDFLPEGYALWQPKKGNMFYLADSIPARIADSLMEGKLESYSLTAEEIKKVMVQGGRNMEFAIPERLAETLDKPHPDKIDNEVVEVLVRKPIKLWKVWTLLMPRRLIKYNTRNLTGDLEAVFLGNRSTMFKVSLATRDLWRVFKADAAMSDSLRGWFTRGGFESTLQVQELSSAGVAHLQTFSQIRPPAPKTALEIIKGVAAWPYTKLWRGMRMATDFRENILRYASYLDYVEQQLQKGGLKNYGASIPEEVDAIEDVHDKAFKLSNDLLGAYDEITATGRMLRENLIPFWSFQEINMKRYWRFMKNAANDSSTAEMVGRRVAITSVRGAVISTKTAFRLGKLALMVMALDTAVNAWNHLMFPDEEDALPETIAGQSHIMLGRRENGDPIYFSRLGLLQDMLEWFGLEDYRLTLNELATGKTTWQEVVKGMVLSPLDKIWQGSRPFYKLAGELAFRRSTFPSVFEPRGIRDRAYHFAKAFGLENEYVALRGLPSRGYQDTMIKFFAYSVNPQESAYGNLLDKKNKFMKKVLKLEGDGFFFSPKGNAMYNYRLAVKLGDKDAERRFFKEYMKYSAEQTAMKGKQFSLGQAFKLMQGSIKRAHPLYGLNDLQKIAFVAQLDERQKKDYAEAFEFWYEILGGNQLK